MFPTTKEKNMQLHEQLSFISQFILVMVGRPKDDTFV